MKATKKLTEAQNSIWKEEKKSLCRLIKESTGVTLYEVGHGNTGGGLTGTWFKIKLKLGSRHTIKNDYSVSY